MVPRETVNPPTSSGVSTLGTMANPCCSMDWFMDDISSHKNYAAFLVISRLVVSNQFWRLEGSVLS